VPVVLGFEFDGEFFFIFTRMMVFGLDWEFVWRLSFSCCLSAGAYVWVCCFSF
jgi:hypothetical protein